MAKPKTEPQPELTGVAAVQEALWQVQLARSLPERLERLDHAMGRLRRLYSNDPISTDDHRKLAVCLNQAKRGGNRAASEAEQAILTPGFRAAQQFLGLCSVRPEYREGYDPRRDWRWNLTKFVIAIRQLRVEISEDPSSAPSVSSAGGAALAQDADDWLSRSMAFGA